VKVVELCSSDRELGGDPVNESLPCDGFRGGQNGTGQGKNLPNALEKSSRETSLLVVGGHARPLHSNYVFPDPAWLDQKSLGEATKSDR
jgi:hypothetical protein